MSKENVAKRCEHNPIIYPGMTGLKGEKGENINGPSLIKVPDWIDNALAKYYLYFAHHQGKYIRLAYANDIKGPWTIYNGETLSLGETVCRNHIASPDVHIDQENQLLRMYFHGPYQDQGQKSFVSFSHDGINFEARSNVLGPFYFRVFYYKGYYYAIAKNTNKGGVILRSKDGISSFEKGKDIIPNLRHSAIFLDNNDLYIFYSRMRDKPERILLSHVDLRKDWHQWQISTPIAQFEKFCRM